MAIPTTSNTYSNITPPHQQKKQCFKLTFNIISPTILIVNTPFATFNLLVQHPH